MTKEGLLYGPSHRPRNIRSSKHSIFDPTIKSMNITITLVFNPLQLDQRRPKKSYPPQAPKCPAIAPTEADEPYPMEPSAFEVCLPKASMLRSLSTSAKYAVMTHLPMRSYVVPAMFSASQLIPMIVSIAKQSIAKRRCLLVALRPQNRRSLQELPAIHRCPCLLPEQLSRRWADKFLVLLYGGSFFFLLHDSMFCMSQS